MAHVLVVEDDSKIADLVGLYLRHDGHEVELLANGVTALHRLEDGAHPVDLVILDLMLPGLDGRGVCRRVRQRSTIPILMLTALDDDRDKIEGLELGADDYLTKPFNPKELVARVHAILRRAPAPTATAAPADGTIAIGAARIEPATRRLLVHGREVRLRTKEFDLLLALAEHRGIVLRRDQLLERVWGGEFWGDTRTVDVHVSRLREKLNQAGSGLAIESVRAVGYRLCPFDQTGR